MLEKSFQIPGRILRVCWQNPRKILANSWQFSVFLCEFSVIYLRFLYVSLHSPRVSLCFPSVICEVYLCFVCVLIVFYVRFMCAGVRLRNPTGSSAHLRAHTGGNIFGVIIYAKLGTPNLRICNIFTITTTKNENSMNIKCTSTSQNHIIVFKNLDSTSNDCIES